MNRNKVVELNDEPLKDERPEYFFKQNKDKAEVVATTEKDVKTLSDLIEVCKIDTNYWKIYKWECNKWAMAYKKDKGKGHTIVPLFQVHAWMQINQEMVDLNQFKNEIISDMKKHSFKYPKIKYNIPKDGCLLVVDLPDIHFGKLAWAEESGTDFDIKIAETDAWRIVNSLIAQSQPYHIDKILYPVGNDFFNVNNSTETTIHGTPQQEDTRWKKTFRRGRLLQQKIIDLLSTIAPVDIIVIRGNHDYERTFYLGDSLECWYHNNPNVKVDNTASTRKYYSYGKNLLGYAHGANEKIAKLPMLMPVEKPDLWAKSLFREWHLGDKHHKVTIPPPIVDEKQGVVIRILRSLTATDTWHFENGFVGALRAGQAFVYDKEKGNIAEFTASI